MDPIFIILIAVAAALLLFLFLIAPRIPNRKQKEPFYGKNFAHRGLYEQDQSIPENSLAAFARAVENGYGMELDVQLSRDGQVVVFHDDTLHRVCGVDARVDELTYEELKELSLCGTGEKIPLFSEVLALVAGRTPIIVELKNGRRNAELCAKTLAFLQHYSGETCIESFNPLIVSWFRRHAPSIFRGQLAQPPKYYAEAGMRGIRAFLLGNLLLNVLARPMFVSYRIGKKPFCVRICEALGAVKVAWTSHSAETERDFDTVIFEYYRPNVQYKQNQHNK